MIVFTNKKNGKPYLFAEEVLDATNDANGRVMCLYYSLETGAGFVRESTEFGHLCQHL